MRSSKKHSQRRLSAPPARLQNSHRQVIGLMLLFILSYSVVRTSHRFPATAAGDAVASAMKFPQARMSQEIAVHARGQGNPRISLADGRSVLTDFDGPAELVQHLRQNQAQPLALAVADFDEDGAPDLVSGYGYAGAGIVSLLRGNVDAVYRESLQAQQRRNAGTVTDAPFMSPALVNAAAEAPDFIGAGDFDGDNHSDLVTAARGSDKLYLLAGDGRGGFSAPEQIKLPGAVTAMITGEINRRDGLEDVMVAVNGDGGPRVLIYESLKGAFKFPPAVASLPAEPTAMALGDLDDDYPIDLAVAAGNEMLIIHGQDSNLWPIGKRPEQIAAARTTRHSFAAAISSLAIGDFTGQRNPEIALLTDDGTVTLLNGEKTSTSLGRSIASRRSKIVARGLRASGSKLMRARVSLSSADDLLMVDPANHQLQFLNPDSRVKSERAPNEAGKPVALDVQGEPVAVVPMRLNEDALNDLVVLRSGQNTVAVVETRAASAPFVVTNTNDSGPNSFRQAILDANANPDIDTITFDLPANPQPTIRLESALPNITQTVTIIGFVQPNVRVELDGTMVAGSGITIRANNSVVRGLVINRFGGNGIFLDSINGGSAQNNFVEGNFIGTDSLGTTDLGNGGDGVAIRENQSSEGGTRFNLIGGTSVEARNIISGNQVRGVFISGSSSMCSVTGNYIGTDVSGDKPLGNSGEGVALINSLNNKLLSNVISANLSDGIIVAQAGPHLVQDNKIGANADGTKALGNRGSGFRPADSLAPPITLIGNIISGNLGDGVKVGIGSIPILQGNKIGTNAAGAPVLGNQGAGVKLEFPPGSRIIANVIAGNRGKGIDFPGLLNLSYTGNTFSQNFIFANDGGIPIDLGTDGLTPNDYQDPDKGPNDLQNYPVPEKATRSNGGMQIRIKLNSIPNANFTVEFFFTPCVTQGCVIKPFAPSPAGNASPAQEGQSFLGMQPVTTDENGDATVEITFPSQDKDGYINTTATDGAGSTSEYSPDMLVEPEADLLVNNVPSSNGVAGGSEVSFCVTVTNQGPGPAQNVKLTMPVPDNTTFKHSSPVNDCETKAPVSGWGCIDCPLPGGKGTVTYMNVFLDQGASAVFTIVVQADVGPVNRTLMATTHVESTTPDGNQTNNDRITSIQLIAPADLMLTITSSPDQVFSEDEITYLATVTNLGPAPALNVEFDESVPVHTTFQSASTVVGWGLEAPPIGSRGTVKYKIANLAVGGSAAFTIVVNVVEDTAAGTEITATASVSSVTPELKANDNSDTAMTLTKQRPPGVLLQEVIVSNDQLTAKGFGFVSPVRVYIDGEIFAAPSQLSGLTLAQTGGLRNGKSLTEAVPAGKVVMIKFLNSDGGKREVPFRK